MDTFLLELFNSISQTKNLTKTAEIFNITQPAVTHNIKKLENLLNVKLISRTNRGIQLTEAGNEYLGYTRKTLEIISEANNRMKNMAEGRYGHIAIATVPATIKHLQRDLNHLHKVSPALQIDVELYEGPELINTYIHDIYDFYYTTSDQIENMKDFDFISIGTGSLHLYINEELAKDVDVNDISTLNHLPLISIPLADAQLASPILKILRQNSMPFSFSNYYKRVESVLLAVSAGIGVAILPSELTKYYKFDGVLSFPLEGGHNCLNYIFAWRKELKSTACEFFKNSVIELYSK